jgi:hypothetical protein
MAKVILDMVGICHALVIGLMTRIALYRSIVETAAMACDTL